MPCERNRRRGSDDRGEDSCYEPDEQADSQRSDQFRVSKSERIPTPGEASPDRAEPRVVKREKDEHHDWCVEECIYGTGDHAES